jgi:molybdopterin/thiamine biosynthesis adenylyltransferase
VNGPPPFSDDEVERYARQLVLREIGGPGQQKLKAARILMIGMGGLGAPASLYLAAAGVGGLVIVDPDRVELSNLQRQVLFTSSDRGRSKVDAGLRRLTDLNPNVETQALQLAVGPDNAQALIGGFDLVLDGTDDFATRLTVSDACVARGVPLVSGAIGRWTGQVGIFPGRPCYRCLVPEIPPDAETCQAVGVIGALAGVVGSMMALEAIKLITGAGESLTGRLLVYDALSAVTRTLRVAPDPQCPACAGDQAGGA